jgi:hypothetical protein
MNTAGKGMQMNGYIAGPFQVVLGTHLFTSDTSVTCTAVSTTACNCMPCTSTGTLNITPLDSLSTVTVPSSSSSVTQFHNREVKDDPLNSSSPEGRVKGENENREYESSCEESVGEKNNMDKRDTGESIEEEENFLLYRGHVNFYCE